MGSQVVRPPLDDAKTAALLRLTCERRGEDSSKASHKCVAAYDAGRLRKPAVTFTFLSE
jgi:hypothetical protein